MPSPLIDQLETARTIPVAFGDVEKGGPSGTVVAEIVHALARTDLQPWRASFRTGALDTVENWTLVQTGTGMTLDPSTGNLNINTGTTINSETILRSKRSFTLPLRAQVIAFISQRIANQEFYIELANTAGDVFVRWLFDGTTATSAKYETGTSSLAAKQTLDVPITILTTASGQVFEIDLGLDEVNFRTRPIGGGAPAEKATRMDNLPHPDDLLYLQLRAKNLGTAPASTTTFQVASCVVQDVNELAVEVVGGRGAGQSSGAVTVSPLALVASNARIGAVTAHSIWQDTNRTAQAISATVTGTGRDLYVVAANTVSSSGSYAKEYRALAVSDVAGTLHLEISHDNVTYRRIKSIATTAQGGNQVAEIQYAPVSRYARVVYVNGGTAQTFFNLSEAYFSS